jgi:hypothetical protein
MSGTERLESVVSLAGTLMLAFGIAACGSSPSAPTSSGTIAGLTLNGTTIGAGSTIQGTVTLAEPATAGGLAVALSSSNPAVATVQTPVTVQAGASSATITITGVAPGAATITAAVAGSSRSAPVTVASGVVLSSITLSAASVVGGTSLTGTAILTATAPAGGAVVALSGGDPVTVPANVTVPAGATSATFTIETRAVGGTTPATISGSYGGASASAVLSVTRPTKATANFGVTGPDESDTCTLIDGGNTINCTFNGSTSTAPGTITAWDWSYGVAKTFTQTTSTPVLTKPAVDCSLLPPPPLPAGTTWFTLTVKLTIHDSLGNVSAEAVNNGVRLFPNGTCGF